MAKTGRGRTKAKPARARRTAGRKAKRAATGGAGAAAAKKRIAALEAENRKLREEVAALQAKLAERPEPAPTPHPGAGQVPLEL
jgi:hypothetical protein